MAFARSQQAITFSPLMRQSIMFFQIARGASNDKVIRPIETSPRKRNYVVNMVSTSSYFAFAIVALASLPFVLLNNVLLGMRALRLSFARFSIAVKSENFLRVGFAILSIYLLYLQRMSRAVIAYMLIFLLFMLQNIFPIIFGVIFVVLLSMLFATCLATLAKSIFAPFVAVEVFSGSRMPLLPFRACIASFEWYNIAHDRTLQFCRHASGCLTSAGAPSLPHHSTTNLTNCHDAPQRCFVLFIS